MRRKQAISRRSGRTTRRAANSSDTEIEAIVDGSVIAPLSSSKKVKLTNNKDSNDVSFMDTEPLDVSVLNTEPVELHITSNDSDNEEGEEEERVPVGNNEEEGEESGSDDEEDEEVENREDDVNDEGAEGGHSSVQYSESDEEKEDESEANENSSGVAENESQSMSGFDSDEDDLDRMSVPPSIDISNAESHEVIKIYSDLIDSCRGFDNNLRSDQSDKKMLMQNISTGESLFRQMEISLRKSFSEETPSTSANVTGRTMLGNSASELHLACQHTKVCSTVLKAAAKQTGASTRVFKLDEFLQALKAAAADAEGNYSVLLGVRKLAVASATASYKVPIFHSLSGCLDKEELSRGAPPPPPPKPRLSRRSRILDVKEEAPTQMEVVNDGDAGSQDINDTQEELAKDVLKSVKTKYRENQRAPNLLEVAHADNLTDMVSRLMGAAFVVRDGHVGVTRDPNPALEASTSLLLKPETPPNRGESRRDAPQRQQFIASYSAKFLKTLLQQQQQQQQGNQNN